MTAAFDLLFESKLAGHSVVKDKICCHRLSVSSTKFPLCRLLKSLCQLHSLLVNFFYCSCVFEINSFPHICDESRWNCGYSRLQKCLKLWWLSYSKYEIFLIGKSPSDETKITWPVFLTFVFLSNSVWHWNFSFIFSLG